MHWLYVHVTGSTTKKAYRELSVSWQSSDSFVILGLVCIRWIRINEYRIS